MTQCWSEGTLRAYLDRELPTEDMQFVAAHLGECVACDGLCTELAARAAHVSALLKLLPDRRGGAPQPGLAANPQTRRRNWIAAAAALAACLALAAYMMPNRHPPEEALVPPAPAPSPRATVAVVTPPLAESPEPPAPRRVRRVRPPAPEPAYFVALDDEPFESGVIMRVDVKPGNLQADIVFGHDGRARGFRLVNATQRNF